MSTPTELFCRAWAGGLPDIGPVAFGAWMREYGTAQAIFEARHALAAKQDKAALRRALEAPVDEAAWRESLYRCGARVLSQDEPDYPAPLRELSDAPPVVYVRGDMAAMERPVVAIVGSRGATRQGLEDAAYLARCVAKAGGLVVSGGARGIDTAAHAGALEAGQTAAVFGCGIDVVFPRENAALFDQIADQGFLLTECPLGMPAIGANFPRRNRLVVALADAVVMVEAVEKSGAMITAGLAARMPRPLYTLPGPMTSPLFAGNRKLLRQGAVCLYEPDVLLADLGLGVAAAPRQMVLPTDPLQAEVFAHLQRGDAGIDELCRDLKISAAQAGGVLTGMVLEGMIKQLPGNRYGV